MRAGDGIHSSRTEQLLPPPWVLDGLAPVMEHAAGQSPGREPVFIIDREADSVAYYRDWASRSRSFIVRANDARREMHQGHERRLCEVASGMAFADV